jgi:hypothetical protein
MVAKQIQTIQNQAPWSSTGTSSLAPVVAKDIPYFGGEVGITIFPKASADAMAQVTSER